MSDVIISPNMNLPVPIVGIDPGPTWANDVNSCLGAIDSHDHTPGSGVQLTPLSLDINTDLPMNNNNLITARTVRFQAQGSTPADPADLGCLTEIGVDLYYIDGSGNLIRLTQSGAPAGATGTITGLPSGTASASFAGTTFTFESATATPASLAVGPTRIAQAVASGFGVTISASGSQAANYSLTLPAALPTVASTLVSDTSGNLTFSGLASGSYTPTLTDVANVSGSTLVGADYFRIGTKVFVTIHGSCTPGLGIATIGVSLPIASDLTSASDANGTCGWSSGTQTAGGWIEPDTTSNVVQIRFHATNNGTSGDFGASFSYEVI